MRPRVLIEACCGSVQEAVAAQHAGADRIELCAALPTGGVTPSQGMIDEARSALSIPIVAMVRPREGGPCPPGEDFRAAVRDVRHAFAAGADEVITGFLDRTRRVDRDRNRALIEAAEGRPMAFHRVFDMCPDLDEALEDVVELGFCRILTSGGAASVETGLAGLRRLVDRAQGRLTILPGGGVRPSNVAKLVTDCRCQEVHFSFREPTGEPGYQGDAEFCPAPDRIRQTRQILDAL